MTNVYILDTSVLISNPRAIHCIENSVICIPMAVIQELNDMTGKAGEKGANAREALRIIDEAMSQNYTDKPDGDYEMNNGNILSIRLWPSQIQGAASFSAAENQVLKAATVTGGVILTRKLSYRIAARAMGYTVREYITAADMTHNTENTYSGRCSIYIPTNSFREFHDNGILEITNNFYYTNGNSGDEKELPSDYKLTTNEFCVLHDAGNPQGGTLLARYNGKMLVKLITFPTSAACNNTKIYGVTPRNVGQIFALEALMAPADIAPLVILKGQAGTAKTFLTMAAGLQQTMENKIYRRMLISRPNTKFDADIGYLKGGELEKVEPLIRPIFDNIENLIPSAQNPAEELISNGTIVAQAMAYMRGRSINNTYIVIDECQNSTPIQIKGLITRPGEHSKIVILGDPDQIDDPYLDRRNNGLSVASELMKGESVCWQVSFYDNECARGKLASSAIERMRTTRQNFI